MEFTPKQKKMLENFYITQVSNKKKTLQKKKSCKNKSRLLKNA